MSITVTTGPSTEVVTTTEVLRHLHWSTADAGLLTDLTWMIKAAREEAEQITGRSIGSQTISYKFDSFDGAIYLPRAPITSVTSVKYLDFAGDEQTVSSADYTFDNSDPPRIVHDDIWPSSNGETDSVRVVFVAGYSDSTCPAAIRQWILLKVGSLFVNRESSAERPAVPLQFVDHLLDRYRICAV